MHDEDQALRQALQRWRADPPPLELADRIAHRATAHGQNHPPGQKLLNVMARAFTEWRYALAYKAAVLTTCALAGILVGQLPLTPAETDLLALALAEDIWAGVP